MTKRGLAIVGIGEVPTSRDPERTRWDILLDVCMQAVRDAGIDKNRSDYAMARSINDLAHFLGQQTIAESVENDAIIVKLEELGVDYLQGWGVGRPRPLADVTAGLSSLEQ